MNTATHLGADQAFGLKHALLVYGDEKSALVTMHPVLSAEGGAPYVGPGALVSSAFLKSLVAAVGGRVQPEILPEHVLVRTPETIVWWSPAQPRTTFYRCSDKKDPGQRFDGKRAQHPALVFKVTGRELSIRALATNARPAADAKLHVAPYYNTAENGHVCQGSMRVPAGGGVESAALWERAYFESAFTHMLPGAKRLTTHPKGFAGLWAEASRRGCRRFPTRHLVAAGESLAQFARRER